MRLWTLLGIVVIEAGIASAGDDPDAATTATLTATVSLGPGLTI